VSGTRNASASAWRDRADRMVRALGTLPAGVAAAMRSVPRHRFVSAELWDEAYQDTPLPLGNDTSTISAPHMVALQLEWAELSPGLHVLEVGSGSGYLLALLAELVRPGGRVVGVELDSALAASSRSTLAGLGYQATVEVVAADGRSGWPAAAPYDRVVVSAATPRVCIAWLEELSASAVLIAPIGPPIRQVLQRLRRTTAGDLWEEGPECRFVSLTPPKPVRPSR
jgi:protein-L-isoaspartate(D-aspartate) O-methyltransferase